MKELAERGEKWARKNGRSDYDVMNTADIADLPVSEITDRNCALFMWGTYPKLRDAFQVMDGWGFEYKTVAFTWVKLIPKWVDRFYTCLENTHPEHFISKLFHFGLGYWTHGNPEIVLLGTKGKPKRVSKFVANLVIAPRGRHSAKPPEVRDRIVELIGDVPRLEMFARDSAPGWDATGLDYDGRDIRDALIEIRDAK